jgi:hypothetical protein
MQWEHEGASSHRPVPVLKLLRTVSTAASVIILPAAGGGERGGLAGGLWYHRPAYGIVVRDLLSIFIVS